jgi:hypothetical protein
VVVVLLVALVDVGVAVFAAVDVEVVVAVERGFTTMNWDFMLSQVAHGSGFDGSNSNRPLPVLQQLAVWSQQKDVSVFVTLPQDTMSGPILGAVSQPWLAGSMLAEGL